MPSHCRAVEPFGAVLITVVLVAIVVSCLSYLGSGGIYRGLGRTGLSLDEPDMRPAPPPGGAAAQAEAREEVRQMLEAKSARREARGEAPLDIDAEVAALTSRPAPHDEALREEVRQLVVARNERRRRRGEEPLDVDAEVRRSLDDLGRS
ncbi:MAG: hypothetical protein M3131_07770 [Actinomycetota bacterium]|nr:hypothetical protein [Actinomycetota bacterium]